MAVKDWKAALVDHGLILLTDPRLPSVASLVAGEPVKGSWWAHPKGRAIFAACEAIDHDPDAVVTRLVSGKITWVHRALWNALFAVARDRAAWQMRGLDAAARRCLARLDRDRTLRCDEAAIAPGVAIALERRLLIHSESVHTERGAHAKRIASWDAWAHRVGFTPRRIDPDRARDRIEAAVDRMNARFSAKGALPWPRRRSPDR